ncbi:unnamed protein product [Closterium sp. Naga37s-1]|nr:unnamed protein product [Closterium sp. Naga37s-1]
MVIAGESWPSPSHAATVSAVSGRSPPASDSGVAALKPPVPPAPKPPPSAAGVSPPPDPHLVTSPAPPSPLPGPSAPVVESGPPLPVEAPAPAVPAVPSAAPTSTVTLPTVADPAAALPVPGVPVSTPAVVDPVAPAVAVASSPMAESATTGGQAPVVTQAVAVQTAVQVAPDPAPPVVASPVQRPPSPGRRQSRPHSPAPRDERAASRRRHDSPRRRAAPPPPAPSAYAVAPAGRVEPPRVPAVGDALSFPAWAGPPRMVEVLEASLGQLWRLAEGLRAVHLIQAYAHAALARGGSLDGRQRDECLDAADRLAELLAPVLAAPAMGVIAGVGQLGTAVRGLRRILRAGSGADVIGASTAAVRELHRSLTGLLAVLDTDQF